tara:strand:+ start:1956 stop:3098 length:1143 start_codon:yes stop_codon:yes gene_type:complete
MKKLTFIFTTLLTTSLFAYNSLELDTVKISLTGNQINIEADDASELEKLLKHDLNYIFKSIMVNLTEKNQLTNTEISMNVVIQNDSIIEQLIIDKSSDIEVSEKGMKKVISISDQGIVIKNGKSKRNDLEISENGIFIQTNKDNDEIDSSKVTNKIINWIGNIGIKDKEEEEDKSTFMMSEIHLGFNNYLNSEQKIASGMPYSLKSTLGSISFTRFAKTRIFKTKPLFVKYGLGISSNNYKFANNYILSQSNNATQLIQSEKELLKSKLATVFIDVPLLIQLDLSFDNKEEDGFNLAVGTFVGYMLKAKTKVISLDANKNSHKEKQRGEFNINKVRYGVLAQFGVLGFNFYGKYHLSTLFESNLGPEKLNVIDFGIVFNL